MSIIIENNNCILLDHAKYINSIYENVKVNNVNEKYTMMSKLFYIKNYKKASVNRKRTFNDSTSEQLEIAKIKVLFEQFRSTIIEKEIKLEIHNNANVDTSLVRNASKVLFQQTDFDHHGIQGGNTSNKSIIATIKKEQFILPQDSRFYCGSAKEQCEKLPHKNYDIVIADPPWWNKFIRRLKAANSKLSYSMLYNEEIASLPIKQLLSDNCIVAVWCTNSPSNINAVKNLIFPSWGVEYLTTWYWMKITLDLEPLCPFGVGHQKQPYERLLLGKVGDVRNVPEERMIMSVPSALHSHKPPIVDLMSPYVPAEKPQVLEVFARYLLPNTTSVGFEPLKWQHISLYEKQ